MTKISIELSNEPVDADQVVVRTEDHRVQLDIGGLTDGSGETVTDFLMEPAEARALAAVLVAQADVAER